MKLFRTALVSAVLLIGSLGVPAMAETVATLDQSASALSSDQSRAANVQDWPMQTFTPSKSGVLTRLDLAIGRSSDRVNAFHIDIFPLNRDNQPISDPTYGNPDDLDTVPIPAAAVSLTDPSASDYHWTTVNLERPVVLVGGQRYLIRLVGEDGDGSFTWYTSSSTYSRGGARSEDGSTIYADDNESVPLQYGFKTWMTPSVFAQSGVWQAGAVAPPVPFDCVTVGGYCPSFKDLSTNFNGSQVFGISDNDDATIHSLDSGMHYSSTDLTGAIAQGGVAGTSMYGNGEDVVLARFCNLWKSADSGASFERMIAVDFGRGDNACFKQVVSTQDGQVMAAVASGAEVYGRHRGVYVSTDEGVTWTETLLDHPWSSIGISADGSKMLIAASDYAVMQSSDSGTTWNDLPIVPLNTGRWNSVAMEATGQIAYMSDNHRIFKVDLSNGEASILGHEDLWTKIQVSTDAQIFVALDDSGKIFVSRDAGQTMARAGSQDISFVDFALAPSGMILHASATGKMYQIDPRTVDSTITPDPTPVPTPKPAAGGGSSVTKQAAVQFAASSSGLSVSVKKAIKKAVATSGKNATYVVTGSAGLKPGVKVALVKGLATKRANVVKAYLIKIGVKRSHITIKIKIVKQGIAPKTQILARYLTS